MEDKTLGFLRDARSELLLEREAGNDSRELSITLTNVDTAILWRQWDLQLKRPAINECSP